MIFMADLMAKVLAGEKTQTRRKGQDAACHYKPGSTYPVTLERGGEPLGRIRVLSVEWVPAHEISPEDAVAEGFDSVDSFLERWRQMHSYPKGYVWKITFEALPARPS